MNQLLFSLTIAFALNPASAEPITLTRINEMPVGEQPAWKAYLEQSQARAQIDQATVEAEAVISNCPSRPEMIGTPEMRRSN
jgi:hypothetical protein